ncbi:hypothetical protein STIAU_0988, partial [Stigmatella aurantiaca DW4/3-1]
MRISVPRPAAAACSQKRRTEGMAVPAPHSTTA